MRAIYTQRLAGGLLAHAVWEIGKVQGNNDRFLASLGKFKDSTKIAHVTKR